MIGRLLVGVLVVSVGVVTACGGATDTGLFGGTSNGADSGSGSDGSTPHDGSVANDASTQHDASTPPDSAPPPPDAGQPDTAVVDRVKCEGTPGCIVGTQACCREGNPPNNFTYACATIGNCNGGALEIPCDKQRDCDVLGQPGDVCCVTAGGTGAAEVLCRPASECTANQGRTALCDPNSAMSCPGGLHCQQSMQTIPGYFICR